MFLIFILVVINSVKKGYYIVGTPFKKSYKKSFVTKELPLFFSLKLMMKFIAVTHPFHFQYYPVLSFLYFEDRAVA